MEHSRPLAKAPPARNETSKIGARLRDTGAVV
jgi:hypothetical protein